jgi:hypothetical protein
VARSALGVLLLLVWMAHAAGGEASALPDSERRLIEALITSVEQLRDARFIRNGKDYSAPDAARFLRTKWESREAEVRSAQDFIEKVATRSSTTGRPYLIRHADGREQPSAELLRARLSELRAPAER